MSFNSNAVFQEHHDPSSSPNMSVNQSNSHISAQHLQDHEQYPTLIPRRPVPGSGAFSDSTRTYSNLEHNPPSDLEVANRNVPAQQYSNHDIKSPLYGSPPIGFHGPDQSTPNNDRRICGLGVKWFWLLLALLLLVIAGAVGGGVGGSVASKDSKKSAATSATTSASSSQSTSATSTSSSSTSAAGTSSSTPLPTTSLKLNSIAATYTTDETTKSSTDRLALLYQDATTNEIVYRLLHESSLVSMAFQPPQLLPVSIQPKALSPMTAYATIDSSATTTIYSYYMDSSDQIIECVLLCPNSSSLTSSTCSISSNTMISTGWTAPSSTSDLTIVNTYEGPRLYYQNSTGYLQEGFQHTSGSAWTGDKPGTLLMRDGTSLSTFMNTVASDLMFGVVYFDPSGNLKVYNNTDPGSWNTPYTILEATTGLNSSLPFGASYEPATADSSGGYLRVEMVSSNNIINETFTNSGQWTEISQTPWSQLTSVDVGSGFSVVSWLGNVRIFYVSTGIVHVAVLSSITGSPQWTQGTINGS
ncbi:uncharacterized protein LY89DRAFT_720739 [Mollisia scopiformis]|uniref:Fucose-specific lectin n=1 Tax=Mollisia scopiformis TaxID=149040 RepID=A0A194X2M1_MOLSC|nr:uncharacterized protein LY89DRAFT_720739 [Mollisia scopiformis]KUJ14431.1 hypothetical protein LY89DRAFT_720739 [Mollisia scopiformis]